MAGRNNRGHGSNTGHGNTSSRSSGRGGCVSPLQTKSTKTGLNKELKGNIFDLGERSSADLMRMTQIKITQYIDSLYSGSTIGVEIETKKEFVTPLPKYL